MQSSSLEMRPNVLKARAQSLLAIDDDLVQRLLICKIATANGCDAVSASSYLEAVARLAERKFDFITLDLSLGERDGIELLRVLADLKCTAKIIIVSGNDQRVLKSTAWIARSMGLNPGATLTKPLNLGLLAEALKSDRREKPLNAYAAHAADDVEITTERLRTAIRNREIVPYFQPKISMATGQIIGCEALARWVRPGFPMVPPGAFLDAVEEYGLMEELTISMLEQSIEAGQTFQNGACPVSVAVNTSASLLTELSLPERIEALLGKYDTPADRLIIEVTETAAMSNVRAATDILVRLRLKGIHLSIDDFGTGYSSLSALAQMPFSELKIDRAFVMSCDHDKDMLKIVNACVGLAKQLNMKTVAEGISSEPLAGILKASGCELGQGFLFSPAIDPVAFRKLVGSRERPAAFGQMFPA